MEAVAECTLTIGGRILVRSRGVPDAEYALFAFDVERAKRALEQAWKLDRTNYELALFLGETYAAPMSENVTWDTGPRYAMPWGSVSTLNEGPLAYRHLLAMLLFLPTPP